MLRFINKMLTKAFITLAAFIFILVISGVNPSELFGQANQGIDTIQGSIGDIQNSQRNLQDVLRSVEQTIR